MSLSVAVVTSTLGRGTIRQAIESVRAQTYEGKVRHYVFAHGAPHHAKVEAILDEDYPYVEAVYLPNANGGGGLAMAPVFAAAPYIVDEDVMFFLDDDNWYEPDHIEGLVTLIEEQSLAWAYSLRKIVDDEGNFICDDNCESLGMHPNATGHYLVDNSCYAVRTAIARQHSHAWFVPVVSDRNFQRALMEAKLSAGTTGKHTANYRLSKDGSGGMSKESFVGNNEYLRYKFGTSNFPWLQKQIFKY
jgi:glycosyltransferase involved in cell wall biosynthesis